MGFLSQTCPDRETDKVAFAINIEKIVMLNNGTKSVHIELGKKIDGSLDVETLSLKFPGFQEN